jgi:hypothetical protein
VADEYYEELPESEDLRERLEHTWEYWQGRNKYIRDIRKMLVGENTITGPTGTPYSIKTLHTYSLAALINEKAARFTQLPLIQVVPEDEEIEARAKSSDLETSINIALVEMERRSDGDVWSRAAIDAITLDEGIERIERAPAGLWKEVVIVNDDGSISLPFQDENYSKLTKEIKKRAGLPIRSVYVPLENFFPVYEGPTLVESFETELRSLRSIISNKMFKGSEGILRGLAGDDVKSLKQQVTLVHYVNFIWHAYYIMSPGTTNNVSNWPNLNAESLDAVGHPILLHAYKHNLGQSIYNCIPGRFGGWKTEHNRIEGVGKGLIELNQAADELMSQVTTNVRAKYWPSLVQKFNPELRGYDTGTAPRPMNIPEGQSLGLFVDESVEPLFQAVDDPAVPWLFDQIQSQIARLGGSPALFGQNAPGVETGYHASLQITQAEHLDEKIEQHLSVGASRRAELILRHIKEMNLGEVWVHATETNVNGTKKGTYHSINPTDLSPLPRLDAQVRRPRPVDLAASIRAAREASDERQGKGPLLSDDTIRQSFLNITAPDVEKHKIHVEQQQNRLIQSGFLDAKIAQALNMMLAVENVPQVGNPQDASPAALEATRQLAGGGSPSPQPNPNAAGPSGVSTGMPTGQDQPEQAAGREIAGAMFGGNNVQASVV